MPKEVLITSRERKEELLRKQFLPEVHALGFEKDHLVDKGQGERRLQEEKIASKKPMVPKLLESTF